MYRTGACWAFAAVAAVEGINAIATGKLVSLSEQELVSCDFHGKNKGCAGGMPYYAFQFIVNNGGLSAEVTYPYTAEDTEQCSTVPPPAAQIRGAEQVPRLSEEALRRAVAGQPVTVGVDSSNGDFKKYESGVFTGPCGTRIDHTLTVVGYGTADDGTKYWLAKNSWGTEWGENGYIRMQRDVEALEGLCAITILASYPTV